ncbi:MULTISPECIES: hypothetical protein [unclassified Curtobacterium]|nr:MULTISPECIES: hypothetical protein [unclassified Curtobacterium]
MASPLEMTLSESGAAFVTRKDDQEARREVATRFDRGVGDGCIERC